MLSRYFKIAARNLLREKSYSVIKVAGLAAGLSFAILILLWASFEIGYDRFHKNTDRLYIVAFENDEFNFRGDQTVGPLGPYLRENYDDITHATRISNLEMIKFEYADEDYQAQGRFVDADFFEMFSFPLKYGGLRQVFADPRSVVISEQFARRVFNRIDVVGEVLTVGAQVPLTVTGVLKRMPDNTEFQADFFLSCELVKGRYQLWDVKVIKNYVMIAPNADLESVNAQIRDVHIIHNPQDVPNYLYLRSLSQMHLYGLDGSGVITYVYVFSALALAILIIASVNFMNLSTARAARRLREIGIKKALGATRSQLIGQFLLESVLVALVSLVIAIVLVEMMLPALNSMFSLNVDLDYGGRVMLIIIGITLLTGLASGSYPAFYLSSFRPASVLQGSRVPALQVVRNGVQFESRLSVASLVRRGLVVIQFSVSIALIIGVLVVFGQLAHLKSMDVGFDREKILLVDLPGPAVQHTAVLKDELSKLANVEQVAVSRGSVTRWQTSFGVWWPDKNSDQVFDVGYREVDPDFAETFGLELISGRFFSNDIPSDSTGVFVMNEALARAMGVDNPVGLTIKAAPGSSMEMVGEVIGVVKDFHTESAHKEIRPFLMGMTRRGHLLCIRVGDAPLGATMAAVRSTVQEIVPESNPTIRFFNDDAWRLYRVEQTTGAVIFYITALAIFISCLGLFGLAAYTVEQRMKEISIRKVLGATVSSVVGLISREFVVLVVLANLIAWPLAYLAMRRWLSSFVFQMNLGWWIFLTAGLVAGAIALLTVGIQSARAASANPAEILRHE